MRAILWAARIPRASMAAQTALTCALATPQCTGHLFASQLQRTADLCCTKVYARAGLERRPTGAEDGRPLSSSAHARTTQDPVRACHGSHLPAALGPHCSNTHQSLQLSPSAMISLPTVQLAECCENVGSGRARTYRVLKTSFHKSVKLPRPPGPLRVGLLGVR